MVIKNSKKGAALLETEVSHFKAPAFAGCRLIEIVKLDEVGEAHFERLVIGPAADTLDDGEAAMIAYAAACGMTAVIDERKATRLCAELFPELRISNTVDILSQPT